MNTLWYESLFFNSLAISMSALSGLIYSHSILHEKEDTEKMKWYEYLIATLISLSTAFVIYLLIFFISGYVPMDKLT